MSDKIKKRFRWTSNLEEHLISIWGDNVFNLRMQKRNRHVYAQMAEEFQKRLGIKIGASEIHIKVNNLSQRYRLEKKTIGLSGGTPSEWPHYEAIDKILRQFPSSDSNMVQENFKESEPDVRIKNEVYITEPDITIKNEPDLSDDNMVYSEYSNNSHCSAEAPTRVYPIVAAAISPSSSSSSSSEPSDNETKNETHNKKRKRRKAKRDFQKELLKQIKRANDLSEQELIESRELRRVQMQLCSTIENISTKILEYFQNVNNK